MSKLTSRLNSACLCKIKPSSFDVLTEKLSHAKEENLEMHQMLDQTLMELNNLWKAWSDQTYTVVLAFPLHAPSLPWPPLALYPAHGGDVTAQIFS